MVVLAVFLLVLAGVFLVGSFLAFGSNAVVAAVLFVGFGVVLAAAFGMMAAAELANSLKVLRKLVAGSSV